MPTKKIVKVTSLFGQNVEKKNVATQKPTILVQPNCNPTLEVLLSSGFICFKKNCLNIFIKLDFFGKFFLVYILIYFIFYFILGQISKAVKLKSVFYHKSKIVYKKAWSGEMIEILLYIFLI